MILENNFLMWNILPNGNVIGQRPETAGRENSPGGCLAPPVLTCPGRAAGRQAALSHCCGSTDARAALLWKVLFVSCIFYFSSLFTSVYCSSLSLNLWDKIIFYK